MNPKYKRGDTVRFILKYKDENNIIKNEEHIGIIEIVDRGTFECPDEISYDIFDTKSNIFYKHINERFIYKVKNWKLHKEGMKVITKDGKEGVITLVRNSYCKIDVNGEIKNYTYAQFKKVE